MAARQLDATPSLRAATAAAREALGAQLLRGDDGLSLGRAHAAFLDRVFGDAFAAASAQGYGGGYALAAVGSYGRGAVALRSDADVRILVGRKARGRGDEAAALAE